MCVCGMAFVCVCDLCMLFISLLGAVCVYVCLCGIVFVRARIFVCLFRFVCMVFVYLCLFFHGFSKECTLAFFFPLSLRMHRNVFECVYVSVYVCMCVYAEWSF